MSREEAGQEIFNKGLVKLENNIFSITGKPYVVTSDSCSCPDFRIRSGICKHIYAIRLYIIATDYQKPKITISEKFTDMINYLASKGNVVSINSLYEKYDNLVDEAVQQHIIHQASKQFILLV